jgi:hypothetical protein
MLQNRGDPIQFCNILNHSKRSTEAHLCSICLFIHSVNMNPSGQTSKVMAVAYHVEQNTLQDVIDKLNKRTKLATYSGIKV